MNVVGRVPRWTPPRTMNREVTDFGLLLCFTNKWVLSPVDIKSFSLGVHWPTISIFEKVTRRLVRTLTSQGT